MALTPEDRRRGGKTAQQRRKLEKRVRIVSPEDVPGGKAPESLDDIIIWAAWLSFAAVTGLLDGTTVREANRSLGTLKVALEKKVLLARLHELEKLIRTYEEERTARGLP